MASRQNSNGTPAPQPSSFTPRPCPSEPGNRKQVRVDRIEAPPGATLRPVDQRFVDDYAQDIARGQYPPIKVVFDPASKRYFGWDFQHRLAAAKQAGLATIAVERWRGTAADARYWAATSTCNLTHGNRASNADKRLMVAEALAMHPETTDRQLALAAGFSHTFVSKVRAEMVADKRLATVARQTGADGITRRRDKTVGKDGKKRKAPTRQIAGLDRPTLDQAGDDCLKSIAAAVQTLAQLHGKKAALRWLDQFGNAADLFSQILA